MVQDTDYGTTSSTILNLFYSKLQVFDQYIIFRTGDNTYSMLVKNLPTGKITRYDVSRSSNYGNYTITSYEASEFTYTVTNEYYVHSNVGLGTMQVLPVHSITLTFAVCGLLGLYFLKTFFRRLFYSRKK